MLMFLKLHVLSCLDLMIDDFSRQYAEHGNAEHGIWQWSLIQATLNQASNRLEGSFLVSFTAITAGFATLTADSLLGSPEMLDRGQACAGKASWLLLPMLMIISKGLLLIYVLLRAARISEKCDRAKQFINSLLPPPAEEQTIITTTTTTATIRNNSNNNNDNNNNNNSNNNNNNNNYRKQNPARENLIVEIFVDALWN
ncbi:unnamed protein product [Polarella glacialis]|uniref:Uncharacterized protein n=1 Tax=Polarella glacialis TaxID=89957 RepID=A0A813DC10_POLGL|nr:unnamed protein product [Polarella glacialis]